MPHVAAATATSKLGESAQALAGAAVRVSVMRSRGDGGVHGLGAGAMDAYVAPRRCIGVEAMQGLGTSVSDFLR